MLLSWGCWWFGLMLMQISWAKEPIIHKDLSVKPCFHRGDTPQCAPCWLRLPSAVIEREWSRAVALKPQCLSVRFVPLETARGAFSTPVRQIRL